jgi:hypothetical protein
MYNISEVPSLIFEGYASLPGHAATAQKQRHEALPCASGCCISHHFLFSCLLDEFWLLVPCCYARHSQQTPPIRGGGQYCQCHSLLITQSPCSFSSSVTISNNIVAVTCSSLLPHIARAVIWHLWAHHVFASIPGVSHPIFPLFCPLVIILLCF